MSAAIEPALTEAEQRAFDALWEVAQDHRLEARTSSGSQYAVTGDIVRQMARAAVAATR